MLEIKSISKSFPGVQALREVSFTIERGEVHALMGENGAGKSTLMKILSGVITCDQGELRLEGQSLTLHSPHDAQRYGIAIIHQELHLVPELSIAENIFLGREPRTPWRTLDHARMEREACLLLDRLNLHVPVSLAVKRLRVGEQQLVEVAKALSLNAQLLILDEPTSALSEAEIERLFTILSALKAGGVTMIYISHKLNEIFSMTDRITVLRDGTYVGTRSTMETDRTELISMMVGRSLGDLFPKEGVPPGEEVLRVEYLSLHSGGQCGTDGQRTATGTFGPRTLHEISFSLRHGEILGIAGLMGAGRTELLETLLVFTLRNTCRGGLPWRGEDFGAKGQTA